MLLRKSASASRALPFRRSTFGQCIRGLDGVGAIEAVKARVLFERSPQIQPRPGQFVIEKQDYSVTGNANFDAILAALGPCHFVAFGVATEYCVHGSVLSLRKLQIPVDLVVDAIKPITEEGGREAVTEMVAAGTRLVTTDEVCAPLPQPTAAGSRG